jgi:hypothetical protein
MSPGPIPDTKSGLDDKKAKHLQLKKTFRFLDFLASIKGLSSYRSNHQPPPPPPTKHEISSLFSFFTGRLSFLGPDPGTHFNVDPDPKH